MILSQRTINCRSFGSRSDLERTPSDFDDEYMPKNIPKMELLKINYVKKTKSSDLTKRYSHYQDVQYRKKPCLNAPKLPRPKSDGEINFLLKNVANDHCDDVKSFNPLKYAVYKRHNDNKIIDRLKYFNDEENKFQKIRKKYSIFDTKKKNKLENIQYFFDSRGYEEYVDKIYGTLDRQTKLEPKEDAWNTKTSTTRKKILNQKLDRDAKNVPCKLENRTEIRKYNDITRISQLFQTAKFTAPSFPCSVQDDTAGSLKKIKKLVDNFDNRCTCSMAKHNPQNTKYPVQENLILPNQMRNNCNGRRSSPQFARKIMKRHSLLETQTQSLHSTKHHNSVKTNNDETQILDNKRLSMAIDLEQSITSICLNDHQLSIKSIRDKSRNTCGYKNCTFTNCPMSSSSASSTAEDEYKGSKTKNTTPFTGNETKIEETLNKKKIPPEDIVSVSGKNKKFNVPTAEDIKNLRNTEIRNELHLKFSENNQNFNNSIKLKSIEKINFNSQTNDRSSNKKQTNNNNKTEQLTKEGRIVHRIKNFMINKQSTKPPSRSSESSSISTGSDNYEIVPDYSLSSESARSSVDVRLTVQPDQHIRSMFPTKLGCDGAIFWNDCYYYDEHACCNCQFSSMKNVNKNRKYLCVCDSEHKVCLIEFVIKLCK